MCPKHRGYKRIAVFHNEEPRINGQFFQVDLDDKNGGPSFWSGPPPRIPSGGMAFAKVEIRKQICITLRIGTPGGRVVLGEFSEPLPKAIDKAILLSKLPDDIQKKLEHTVKFLDQMGGHNFDKEDPPPTGRR